MARTTASCDYIYRLECNKAFTWREHLGGWLRRLAQRLDGRYSLAIKFTTTPRLSTRQELHIIKQGLDAITASAHREVRQEAEDLLFRDLHPQLFESK